MKPTRGGGFTLGDWQRVHRVSSPSNQVLRLVHGKGTRICCRERLVSLGVPGFSPASFCGDTETCIFFFKLINPQPCLNPNLEQMQCIWSVDLELQISPVGNQIFKERLSSVFLSLPLCFPKLSCQDQPRDLNFPVVTATGLYSFSRKGVRMP